MKKLFIVIAATTFLVACGIGDDDQTPTDNQTPSNDQNDSNDNGVDSSDNLNREQIGDDLMPDEDIPLDEGELTPNNDNN